MRPYTQKYTIVSFENELPLGYEFSMENWPPHVTLVDVFVIKGEARFLFEDLLRRLELSSIVHSRTIAEEWFGEKKTVHVSLVEKTKNLMELHTNILDVLEKYGVIFNNPEYTREGFLPHITLQAADVFEKDRSIRFNTISLIDMFPNKIPTQRKIIGTIQFQAFGPGI